jgi:hypothetical protein
MKYVYYFLILVFVAFAGVQYNDPDSALWILLYLLPIFFIWRKIKGTQPNETLYFVGLMYIFWAINQFPPEWEGLTLDAMGMKTINIELGRESLGLGFTGLVLWVLTFLK